MLLAENENGKTSFLRALGWFSLDDPFDESDRWSGADGAGVLDIVSLTFELREGAKAALEDEGFATPDLIRIVKDTAGARRVENAVANQPLAQHAETAEELFADTRDWLVKKLSKYDHPLAQDAVTQLSDALPENLRALPVASKVEVGLIPTLEATDGADLAAGFDDLLRWEAAAGDETESDAYEVLVPFLPRLIYFTDLDDQVADEVTYADVAADPVSQRTMVNLAASWTWTS